MDANGAHVVIRLYIPMKVKQILLLYVSVNGNPCPHILLQNVDGGTYNVQVVNNGMLNIREW